MAVVYLARDLRHGRDVAVKVFQVEGGPAEGAPRFLHEIQIAARLAHPNILPLHDSGESDGLLYYVMPFVPGESLRQRLEREGALPVGDALLIATEVAGALAYAHSHGVIHRDIKPENILFIAGHSVVADFGIARAISAGGWDDSQLGRGPMGTPAYMSPEQARGASRVDGRSDIYSLGCMLYEMLTGEPPFRGSTPEELVVQHLEAEPLPVQTRRPTLSRELQLAVGKALAKHPADRYQTAQQFGDTLAKLISDQAHETVVRDTRETPIWATPLLRRWALPALAVGTIAYALIQPSGVGGWWSSPDPDRYLVAPFVHEDSVAPELLSGDQCERLVHQALTRWTDVSLVDTRWTADRLAQLGRPPTLDDLTRLARTAKAGKLLSGEVYRMRDSIRVRGVLYDVTRQGHAVREYEISFPQSLADADREFVELADSLLLPKAHTALAGGGAMGTHQIAAWEAYDSGHVALARWDLPEAMRHFRNALDRDPAYGLAQLWLAQTLNWHGDPVQSWRDRVLAGLDASQSLAPQERAWALALGALAQEKFPEACERYQAMIRKDSLDFRGWYGRAECRARDHLVIADKKSPSGWSFRSSYQAAINDYQRALTLVPSSHLAFKGAAFDRLTRMLFTELNAFRAGESGPSDTVGFAAFVGWAGDSVSFIPYPRSRFNDFQNPMLPATATAAVLHNRGILRRVTTSWAASFPQSADALEADGIALEKVGEIRGAAMTDSARFRFQRARQVSRDTADRARLGASEVRLLVKTGRFAEAKRLADSLLGTDAGSIAESEYYAGLAALTGRASRAASLNRRAAPRYVLPSPLARKAGMPLPLRETALRLEAFSALGGPGDSVRGLLARYDRESKAFLAASERATVDGLVLPRMYALMYPRAESRPGRAFADADDYLLAMQSRMWQGDTAEVRRRFRQLAEARRQLSPGAIAPEASFAEAEIELQLGDTAAAQTRLDGLLESLPTLGVDVLVQLPQAGALVRAMMLRARLASLRGDDATARRWAQPAATLWASADAGFRGEVTDMRRLAGYH